MNTACAQITVYMHKKKKDPSKKRNTRYFSSQHQVHCTQVTAREREKKRPFQENGRWWVRKKQIQQYWSAWNCTSWYLQYSYKIWVRVNTPLIRPLLGTSPLNYCSVLTSGVIFVIGILFRVAAEATYQGVLIWSSHWKEEICQLDLPSGSPISMKFPQPRPL